METKKYKKMSFPYPRPSSPRSVSMRGIGAAHTLYPAYQPCGMTKRVSRVARMTNSGFTLIELLVVVLIIGILAAVALPQYQKTVWKSRNVQLKTLVKTVAQARDAYHLANGSYPTNFDELTIDLPLPSNNRSSAGPYTEIAGVGALREADDFWIVITPDYNILAFWVTGKYDGGGFSVSPEGTMVCVERAAKAGTQNNFCTTLEKATFIEYPNTWKCYSLP